MLTFSGGHDEGSVESITLIVAGGKAEMDLPTWYCGGYGWDNEKNTYKPLSEPANEDEELADLLEGPINERFGAWGGAPSTYGTLTWDVATGDAKLSYTQDEPADHEEVVVMAGFKAEVIADSSGKWAGNALVFPSESEAEIYVSDLALRWTLVRDTRVVPTDEKPNYRIENGVAVRIEN